LVDSGGIKAEIAESLGVSRAAVEFCLAREGSVWDAVREKYQEECDDVIDAAQSTIKWMIEQRLDLALAERASRWYLEKRLEEFTPKQSVTVETKSFVSINQLDLPLDIRRLILDAVEKAEKDKG